MLGLCLAVTAAPTLAAAPNGGTSNRAAREDAVRSIPFEKLRPEDHQRVTAVVSDNSLYRRLPTQVIECDPDLYLFLVRHPEVVVNIWEVMKISNVTLARTGRDTFRASDNAGTLCDVKYCYSAHDTQVIYAEGTYNGPLLSKPVRAKCVLLLKSGYVQETNGRFYVTNRMDTFIQIDHAGLELLAKTLQPLLHRSADYNFVETASFFSTISRTAEANPAGMHRLAGKLTKLETDVRARFAELAVATARKARDRQSIQTSALTPDFRTGLIDLDTDRR